MSQKSLILWVVAEESGKIITGHRDCMAGLGESCSHVASLLWAVESGVRIKDSMKVTEKAYWVIPSSVKEVPYAPVRLINFEGREGSLTKLTSPQSSPSSKFTATICSCNDQSPLEAALNKKPQLMNCRDNNSLKQQLQVVSTELQAYKVADKQLSTETTIASGKH